MPQFNHPFNHSFVGRDRRGSAQSVLLAVKTEQKKRQVSVALCVCVHTVATVNSNLRWSFSCFAAHCSEPGLALSVPSVRDRLCTSSTVCMVSMCHLTVIFIICRQSSNFVCEQITVFITAHAVLNSGKESLRSHRHEHVACKVASQ